MRILTIALTLTPTRLYASDGISTDVIINDSKAATISKGSLTLAPLSTLAGFRRWVVEECPVAPGRRAPVPASLPVIDPVVLEASGPRPRPGSPPRDGTKTARFLALVAEQHGPLGAIPIPRVSRISAALAPQVGLNAGAARTALRRAVLAAARDGGL